jgi:hypothetical protein
MRFQYAGENDDGAVLFKWERPKSRGGDAAA